MAAVVDNDNRSVQQSPTLWTRPVTT